MAREPATSSVRLKPADPFDLIRLIAQTQSDPRKALAELVQNSLDAGAENVRVTWFSHGGHRAVAVHDDGHGVFPELQRPAALERLATTIGHSHKRNLSPAERHREMTLGKYGIGLLGFWSVGRLMEIRTRVAESDVYTLTLERDQPDARLQRRRGSQLPLLKTFTEVVITGIDKGTESQLKPRRLAAYLSGELRGQLLQRQVLLEIHDRVGRGRAQKRWVVRPQKYQGVPLSDFTELEIDDCAPASLELYLLPETDDRHGHVQLACGGTTVLDDLALIDGIDSPRAPWSSGRFEGVVDFPDLHVSPATRRGFVPDRAAYAFLEALPALEEALRELLQEEDRRRDEERQADDAKDIRRAFRKLTRTLPYYSLMDLKDRDRPRPGGDGVAATGEAVEDSGEAEPEGVESGDLAPTPEEPPGDVGFLFPAGPLAAVVIRPKRSVLPPDGRRRLKATAIDGDRRPAEGDVEFSWVLEGSGAIEIAPGDAGDDTVEYVAPSEPCEATVTVTARQGDVTVDASAKVIASDDADTGDQGVPDPEPVEAPGEPWRSRFFGGVWQYNCAHPDYRRSQSSDRQRLRYLTHLFAKEVVLRNFGWPTDSPLLERMVEVLTHLEDPTAARPRRKG